MEFAEAVARRRMVRRYKSDPVDPAALDRILDAARRSPSAGFSQGVELVVITSNPGRARLAAAAGEATYLERGFEPWLSTAPVHVIVAVDPGAYRRRYDEPDKAGATAATEWPVPYWWIDAGAALMLLLLATADEGLAAGFLGAHAFTGLGQLAGLPPELEPIGVVTIGHGLPTPAIGSARRSRRPRRDTEHAERWGTPRRPDDAG